MDSVHQDKEFHDDKIDNEMHPFDSNKDTDECVKSQVLKSYTQSNSSLEEEIANELKLIQDGRAEVENHSLNSDSNEDMECSNEPRKLRLPSEEMSPNEEHSDFPDDSSSFDARRTRRSKVLTDFKF